MPHANKGDFLHRLVRVFCLALLEGSIIEIEAQITEAREAVATAEQEVSLVEAAWTHRATASGTNGRRLRRL